MEAAFGIGILCGTPLFLALIGALGGFIGGKMSSKVLRELDPGLSQDVHVKIIKRSTLGFFLGFVVGGIPMGWGLASAAFTAYVALSYQWALYVAVGFALTGIIGTTIAGSAIFFNK